MDNHHDVYERLARKLDQLPQGFPAAADRVDLALLRWAFEPEEAALAVALPPMPETAEALAQRMERSQVELSALLDRMCKKGQIASFKLGGQSKYAFSPWFPGIQEGQLYRRDRTPEERLEYVHLWERYFPTHAKTASYGPPVTRVVPVSVGIKSEARPHRLEDVHRMVENAKSFLVMPCVCREEKVLLEKGCDHSLDVCLIANAEDDNFEKWPEAGRVITKEEAHRILDKTEEEGLVHQTWNADSPSFFFICNCCPCCCVLLRQMNEFGQAHVGASNFVASIDTETCIQCTDCLDDRCAVDAIAEEGGDYAVDQALCIGCGICTVRCPVDAIELRRKPEQVDLTAPAVWAKQRVTNRPETL